MSLSLILDKINEQKTIAEQDLHSVHPRSYPYKKGQVESAKARLEQLYIDYKNELLKNAVFILVTGDQAGSFANIAEEKFKCFSVEGKSMFKEMLSEVNPQVYVNKKVNAFVFEVLSNILEDKLKSLDVLSYNQLLFNSKYSRVVKNEEEMLEVVTSSIADIVGLEIVGLDALEKVTKQAVNKNYKSRIVPILIHSDDEVFVNEAAQGLKKLTQRVATVSAGKTNNINSKFSLEDINENSIEETLKTIAANA